METVDSLSKTAFAGQMYIGPVVSKYSFAKLWNPSGSGRIVIVYGLHYDSPSVVGFGAEIYSSTSAIGTSAVHAQNKYLGAAASKAELRKEDQTAYPNIVPLGIPQNPPEQSNYYQFVRPIIVPEGMGLIYGPEIQNVQVCMTWDFTEK